MNAFVVVYRGDIPPRNESKWTHDVIVLHFKKCDLNMEV